MKKSTGLPRSSRRSSILQAAPDAFLAFDEKGRVLDLNEAAVQAFGFEKTELSEAGSLKRLMPGHQIRRLFAAEGGIDPSIVSEMGTRWWAASALRRSGEAFPVEVSIRRLQASSSSFYVAYVRDVSVRRRERRELVRAREEAMLASRAKSEFLTNMSHEIRTPLNAVIGMADLLAETPLAGDQRSYVAICRRAGRTLLGVVDDILDLSKIEAGQLQLESIAFDLHELVKAVAGSMAMRAREKSLVFSLRIAPDAPRTVRGDPARVRQIAANLLGNAIKFTDRGAVALELTRGALGDGVVLSIRDSGAGMPAEFLARIFDKFAQADSSSTRKHGGTGLGLAICKRLVDAMQGSIEVVNREKGAEFIVRLPLQVDERRQSPGVAFVPNHRLPSRPAFAGRGMRLLLVEDSADNRALVVAYLRGGGFTLDCAENGSEGLRMAKENVYGLILMDMQMPVMDGYTATREIRLWETRTSGPRTPILALTAHALREEVTRCLDAGCDGHLAKPVNRIRLIERIRDATEDGKRDGPKASFTESLGRPTGKGPCGPDSAVPRESPPGAG